MAQFEGGMGFSLEINAGKVPRYHLTIKKPHVTGRTGIPLGPVLHQHGALFHFSVWVASPADEHACDFPFSQEKTAPLVLAAHCFSLCGVFRQLAELVFLLVLCQLAADSGRVHVRLWQFLRLQLQYLSRVLSPRLASSVPCQPVAILT